jgi:hypothetical protein
LPVAPNEVPEKVPHPIAPIAELSTEYPPIKFELRDVGWAARSETIGDYAAFEYQRGERYAFPYSEGGQRFHPLAEFSERGVRCMASERAHLLEGVRLGVLLGVLFASWGVGVFLMIAEFYFMGLFLAATSIVFSIWLFSSEISGLLRSEQVVPTSELKIAVLAIVFEIAALAYVGWELWPQASPLLISAEVGPGNYPENEPMGEIRWHPARYAAARVRVTNDSSDDYTSVVLIVHSELLIEEMTEETGTADCSILPDEDLSKMGHMGPYVVSKFELKLNGANGKQYLAPIPEDTPWPKHLIAPDKDYRIACDRVSGRRAFVLLAAIINPGPKLNPLNPPRPPHWIDVTAKYIANGRRLTEEIGFDCANGPCTIRRSRWRQRLDALFDGDC